MRRKHGRSLTLPLAGLLSALLIFSGCVTMEFESDFNEDGSATHSMALSIDMSQLEQFAGEELEDDPFENFDQIEREAEEQGFRVERIEDGNNVGLRLIQDVDDSSDLGAILNNLFNAGSESEQFVEPFSGTFEKDGDDFRLNLTVDGSALTSSAGEELGEGEDLSELGFDMSMFFDFSYTARMPGEIDEDQTNGRIGADGVITWELPLQGSETLTAASKVEGGGSNLWLVLIAIGIFVVGLLALAAVAFFIFMNRRSPQPATATPAGPAPAPGYSPAAGTPPAPRVDPNQPTERIPPPADRGDDEPRSF